MKVGLCGGRKKNKTYQNYQYYCDSEKAGFNHFKKSRSKYLHETALPKHCLMCGYFTRA